MNEITRIHLAKVPFSIEIDAKKALQKYLDAITTYAGLELSADVESRMVEILADRNVASGGVVAMADVVALKEQLGAPEEFSDETAVVSSEISTTHRLFRDTTRGWFGGVAAGIGRYYHINPLWIRLAFLVLALFSFGAIVLIYVVLWALIPPVRTAADILQLEGKPATVTAIHALNEHGEIIPVGRDRRFARVMSVLAGLAASFGAFMLLLGVVIIGVRGLTHGGVPQFFSDTATNIIYELVVLVGVLLFIVLLGLIAYFLFSWKWTRRLWLSGVIVIALGLIAIGVVATGAITNRVAIEQRLSSLTHTTTTALPNDFHGVTSVSLSAEGTDQVVYIVSNKPRIEVQALPGGKAPRVTLNGSSATIDIDETNAGHGMHRDFLGYAQGQSLVTIYGPALQHFTVRHGSINYDAVQQQTDHLTINVTDGAQLSLGGGKIASLQATVADNGSFDATNTAVSIVDVTLGSDASVTLGNIATLTVTAPDVCPGGDYGASIEVGSVNASDITYNGKSIAKRAMTSACATLSIDNQGE